MQIIPKQTIEERSLVITGKRYCGCSMVKQLIAVRDYDENGNQYGFARFSVQRKTSNGTPVGRVYFGDESSARRYFLNDLF